MRWPMYCRVGFLACIGLLAGLFASPVRAADEPAAHPKKKIVFISGKPSHGFAQHEQYAGCMLLAKCLSEGMSGYDTVVYKHADWPKPEVLDSADAIVIFCDGGGGHLALPHLDELAPLMDKEALAWGASITESRFPRKRAGRNWRNGSAGTSKRSGRLTRRGRRISLKRAFPTIPWRAACIPSARWTSGITTCVSATTCRA